MLLEPSKGHIPTPQPRAVGELDLRFWEVRGLTDESSHPLVGDSQRFANLASRHVVVSHVDVLAQFVLDSKEYSYTIGTERNAPAGALTPPGLGQTPWEC